MYNTLLDVDFLVCINKVEKDTIKSKQKYRI